MERLAGSCRTGRIEGFRVSARRLPPLFGIGGKLASGKDTVADHLVEKYGFVKLGMSDPLNEALIALDPWIPYNTRADRGRYLSADSIRYSELLDVNGYTAAKRNPEVRRLLQVLGTEVGRKMIGENTWTDIALRKIAALRDAGRPVVITGIRFPNELAMIDDSPSARSLWVYRDEAPKAAFQIGAHLSENSVDGYQFDIQVGNTGTVPELHQMLDLLIQTNTHLWKDAA